VDDFFAEAFFAEVFFVGAEFFSCSRKLITNGNIPFVFAWRDPGNGFSLRSFLSFIISTNYLLNCEPTSIQVPEPKQTNTAVEGSNNSNRPSPDILGFTVRAFLHAGAPSIADSWGNQNLVPVLAFWRWAGAGTI